MSTRDITRPGRVADDSAAADTIPENLGDTERGRGDHAVRFEPGFSIGPFVVEAFVAAGGFGSVYRVNHPELGRQAALKVLHAELASSPQAVARFEREARAVNVIRHPNVVDIYDFGSLADGRPFFVMEYLEGQDLDSHLDDVGRLSPGETMAIFDPLCQALSAAHDNGIVHRDIKASNVFLERRGETERVVLLDFGVAKLLDDDGASALTTARHVVGTPASMAPEQIRGQPVTARTDIYSLGALLFHAITGKLPFAHESAVITQHLHLRARPPSPSQAAPIGAQFDAVVHRAMAKRPEERHATPAELLAELRRAVAATPTAIRAMPLEHGRRTAIAVRLHASAPDEALVEADPGLLDDFELVIPMARDLLLAHGLRLARESGDHLIMVLLLEGSAPSTEERERAVAAVRATLDEVARRPTRDPRLSLDVVLEACEVIMAGTRILARGLDQHSRLDPDRAPGVYATSALMGDDGDQLVRLDDA